MQFVAGLLYVMFQKIIFMLEQKSALPLQIGIILQEICFDFKSTCL